MRLADAFLHGHIYLTDHPSWLSELIPRDGVYYVPYPPMPAILLMPLVAIFGTELPAAGGELRLRRDRGWSGLGHARPLRPRDAGSLALDHGLRVRHDPLVHGRDGHGLVHRPLRGDHVRDRRSAAGARPPVAVGVRSPSWLRHPGPASRGPRRTLLPRHAGGHRLAAPHRPAGRARGVHDGRVVRPRACRTDGPLPRVQHRAVGHADGPRLHEHPGRPQRAVLPAGHPLDLVHPPSPVRDLPAELELRGPPAVASAVVVGPVTVPDDATVRVARESAPR